MITLNNRWTQGKMRFNFKIFDKRIFQPEGIIPISVCLSESVGSEMALFYIDHTPFVHELGRINPLHMYLKSGLGRTSVNPVLFHLFSFHKANNPEPVLLVDAYANPFNLQQMTLWRDLSRQTHWHLFLVDKNMEQAGFFEYENNFNLDHTLDAVGHACQGMESGDFNAAKAEFCSKYSLDDLNDMN